MAISAEIRVNTGHVPASELNLHRRHLFASIRWHFCETVVRRAPGREERIKRSSAPVWCKIETMLDRVSPRWRLALLFGLPYGIMTAMIAIHDSPEMDSLALVPLYIAATVSAVAFLVIRRRFR